MSGGTRIRTLAAAVGRLEAATGKGRKCAFCRLHLRTSWPAPERPKPGPEDVIKPRCEFCGNGYTVNLARLSGVEREALRLYYSFSLEDYYTNPRAHALFLWLQHQPVRKKARAQATSARKKDGDDPGARALSKLREEAGKLSARKHKRLEGKYGKPFPEHLALVASVQAESRNKRVKGFYADGLFEFEGEHTSYLIRAELEKIIWGETRAETAAAAERLAREIDELVTAEREKKERLTEETRLRNLDFLNQNRERAGMPPLPDDYGK